MKLDILHPRSVAALLFAFSTACLPGTDSPEDQTDEDTNLGASEEALTDATSLSVGTCTTNASASCLKWSIAGVAQPEIWMANEPRLAVRSGSIGRMFGGARDAAYVYHVRPDNSNPAVFVFDLNRPALVAWAWAPAPREFYTTYFSLVQGPGGKKYPFMAQASLYTDTAHIAANARPFWRALYQFDPAYVTSPSLPGGVYTGFRSVDAGFSSADAPLSPAPFASTYRHGGGFMLDVDGDGWEDIHLPYLWNIVSISGRTGAKLTTTTVDVAKSPVGSPIRNFHSGRQYASFHAFRASDGSSRVFVSSQNPVGSFGDPFCNVSRYQALINITPSAPKSTLTSRLLWSNYDSFAKAMFGSGGTILRQADGINQCGHRFADGYFQAGTIPISVFSSFMPTEAYDNCTTAQRTDDLNGAVNVAWPACANASYLPVHGRWTLRVVRLSDGAGVTGWQGGYGWGRAESFAPGGTTYIVEYQGNPIRFDRQSVAPGALYALQIGADLTFKVLGSIAAPGGVPKLSTSYYFHEGAVGESWGGLPELVTRDVDGDGYVDVQLTNGAWVGMRNGAFVKK